MDLTLGSYKGNLRENTGIYYYTNFIYWLKIFIQLSSQIWDHIRKTINSGCDKLMSVIQRTRDYWSKIDLCTSQPGRFQN